MQEWLGALRKISLFRGIQETDLLPMLSCLGAQKRIFSKGQAVFHAGDPALYVGAVLSGQVQVCRENQDGNRMVMANIQPGELFAEAYACAQVDVLPVTVWSLTDCVILLLDCKRMVAVCPSACAFHNQLVSNLLSVLADKNILLSGKITHLSKRTLREKLLSYLEEQATRAGSNSFIIPFDRQALADYLCVDRSALSRELGALRQEGYLTAEKSRFTLRNNR